MPTLTEVKPSQTWKDVFTWWPAGVPKRGVLVDALNETIPFKSFLIRDEMLLLERTNPDPLGARFILLPFEAVHSIKLVDPLKESVLVDAGFCGKLAKA